MTHLSPTHTVHFHTFVIKVVVKMLESMQIWLLSSNSAYHLPLWRSMSFTFNCAIETLFNKVHHAARRSLSIYLSRLSRTGSVYPKETSLEIMSSYRTLVLDWRGFSQTITLLDIGIFVLVWFTLWEFYVIILCDKDSQLAYWDWSRVKWNAELYLTSHTKDLSTSTWSY